MMRNLYRILVLLPFVLGMFGTSWAGKVSVTQFSNPDPQPLGWFGRATDFGGDVNGDGIGDMIVAAPQLTPMDGDGREGDELTHALELALHAFDVLRDA